MAGFIGEPPANFVDCDVLQEDGKYSIACPAFPFRMNEVMDKTFLQPIHSKNCLGVRPEDICISFYMKVQIAVGWRWILWRFKVIVLSSL